MELRTPAGTVRGVERGGLAVFLGLPYAAAPEGERRFAAPVPVAGWDGVRDATRFGPAAPQGPPAPGAPSPWRPGDGLGELTLNVWTPEAAGSGLPVLVWFHGGAWVRGAPSMPLYDAAALAAEGVVVVTVGFRLGAEGFLALPGAPENRGLRDQLAALTWVHEHVAAFGGDPGCVTAAGQSGGGASVAVLLAHPATAGLLQRAVVMSVHEGFRTPDDAAGVTARLAAALDVAPTAAGFRAVAPERLVAAQDVPLRGHADGITAFGPVVDGDVVLGQPWEGLALRPRPQISLLVTGTREEARAYPLPPLPDAELQEISDALHRHPTRRVARAHAAAGGPTWSAELTWRSPLLGAAHGLDVPLLFGTLDTRPAARMLGAPPPDEARAVGAALRRDIVRFATTGDPGWAPYDLATGTTRLWDTTVTEVPDPIGAPHGDPTPPQP
ncbi:carboxylesterase family protein [Actinomycetospora chlora]|uniref:Carboxylesterase family protein n=1 Tax=Actinomycetospora chlora TaxID=663608 RepID=A0ABP9AFX6_9PSEU